ncbi:MAG: SDR family oxidoreductase [Candidatus Bathyarchaeia archaeon]|jgi:UDP-glucose 4-epimerase
MTNSAKYRRILVTGGAGFIGSHVVDKLMEDGYVVTVIDNLHTGSLTNIDRHTDNPNLSFINGDIRDIDLVKKALKDVDVVFHEAALASVSLSVKDPIFTDQINVEGTLDLLKASCDQNVKRFIYASSAAVYGKTKSSCKKEDDHLSPASPYGVSKLAAENYVQVFQRLYGIETVCLRYFNVYGPRQKVDVHGSYGGVISIFINRILKNMPPIINGDGEQTRDFVYIHDVVKANMLAMNTEKGIGEAFNIATGKGASINKVAETLKQIMNKKELKDIHTEPRPTDIKHGYADISKAREILGYEPQFSIEEGLADLVHWYTKKNSKYEQK